MAYETTEVAVSKSQDQIRRLIYAHKGTGLILVSQPPREGFEAMVELEGTAYHIRIMATCKDQSKYKRGYSTFYRKGKALEHAREQEERRVWRVLYWHLKAVFEAADAGVIDIRDVILPYVVMRDGLTIADRLKPRMRELMTLEPGKLLLGTGEVAL